MSLVRSAADQSAGLVRPSAASGPSAPAVAAAPSTASVSSAWTLASTGRANAANLRTRRSDEPLHGLRRDIAGRAARTKIGVSTVSDCAAWVGDGISRELSLWPLPLPDSAVPIMAMPMAAPIRWGVISAPPTEPTWSLPSPDPADGGIVLDAGSCNAHRASRACRTAGPVTLISQE
jgi:hypothetical protein